MQVPKGTPNDPAVAEGVKRLRRRRHGEQNVLRIEGWLTEDEAAAFLDLTVAGLRKLVLSRSLPLPAKIGSTDMYKVSTIKAWLRLHHLETKEK